MKVDWNYYFYYDETSPSSLRWNIDVKNGFGRQTSTFKHDPVGGGSEYYETKVRNVVYKVHRIIYEMLHNTSIPHGGVIDHKDGNPRNNTVSNLRLVTIKANNMNQVMAKNNKSGKTGIVLDFDSRGYCSWKAIWNTIEGLQRGKKFSINKYGDELARFLAEEYRDLMLRKLNLQGASYTERHGT